MLADSWAMSAASRTALSSSSRSSDRAGRVGLGQDLLVVRELAVDEPADEVDASRWKRTWFGAAASMTSTGSSVSARTRISSLSARAGTTTLVSGTASRIGTVLTAIR